MQQVVRRRVIVKSNGLIQFRAPELLEGTTAEVLVIVEGEKPPVSDGERSELRESIAAYAVRNAGSEADLDLELEDSAVDFLAHGPKGKRR
jgi:hypothetical protein